MDYFVRKWSKKARKSMIEHILAPDLRRLDTSLGLVTDEDKCKVTQFMSEFKSGSIQSCGFYGISRSKADKFIKQVYEIKGNISLKPFKELI